MTKADPVLKQAAEILIQSEKEGVQPYAVLHASLNACRLKPGEKAKVTALVNSVYEHLLTVDYILNLFSKTKTNKMKPVIRAVLRLGVCMLMFMERTGDAGSVSACVELTREKGYDALTGYVNGVLRTVGRQKQSITYPDLSTKYSMPSWICDRMEARFPGKTEALLQYFEQENTVTLRLNESLSPDMRILLKRRIEASSAGISVRPHPLLAAACILEQAGDVRTLPGFAEGAFYVQDAGAQLAVELAGIKAGDQVIDVCAAPGGKSLHAYEKCLPACEEQTGGRNLSGPGRGGVVAMDLTERKCALIRDNAKRLHAEEMEILVHDAREVEARLCGQADVVICDLPCSGLGIMGRKADIRYRLREEDISELAALQREILRASLSYLKKGGTLLYVTCTLTPEENEDNARFIEEELGLAPVDLRDPLSQVMAKKEAVRETGEGNTPADDCREALMRTDTLSKGYLTLEPGRYLTDGFFVARFCKK